MYEDIHSISKEFCKTAVCRGMTGLFFCNAGYLKKAGDLSKLSESGTIICAATRKNMNRLMSRFECHHIKHRSIIESDWGTLKNNFQLEYHKARSIVGIPSLFLQHRCLHD